MKQITKSELIELEKYFDIIAGGCPFEIGLQSPIPHKTCKNENPTNGDLCIECWQTAIEAGIKRNR